MKKLYTLVLVCFIFLIAHEVGIGESQDETLKDEKLIFLDWGDSIKLDNGKTLLLEDVTESGEAIINIDGVRGQIKYDDSKIVNGVYVRVETTFWETVEEGRAVLLGIIEEPKVEEPKEEIIKEQPKESEEEEIIVTEEPKEEIIIKEPEIKKPEKKPFFRRIIDYLIKLFS